MSDPATLTQTIVTGTDFAIKQGTGIANYLKRKHGYVKDIEQNYAKLEDEYDTLCAREKFTEDKLERCEAEADETKECEIWRGKVKEMKVEVEKLKTAYGDRPCGPRHYLYLMKLGRRIVKMTEEVAYLTNAREKMLSMMIQKPPPLRISNPTKENIKLASVEKNVKKLKEYLRNEKIKTICVWGPVGVGKSRVMDRLHQEIKVPEDFHIVFKVAVGKGNDEERIQKQLLKRLKINQENLSAEERRSKINEKLKKCPSYLLLLDDVFSKINLEEIGITDEHQGKVVFATRYRVFCQGRDEELEVDRLSDTDARKMFWEIVGLGFRDNPDIVGEAELIIKFCSGMPYLIELIGKHLSNRMSIEEKIQEENANIAAIWRKTWDGLTSPTGEPRQNLEIVYRTLRLEIERLYERIEQFLNGFPKLRDARDDGNDKLLELVGNSLLKKGKVVGLYTMFEFYQRLAFRFAEDENSYMPEIGREIKWEVATRISMIGNSCFLPLPKEPKSERILTLLLHEINCLSQFPTSFFQRMSLLQLLDLYKTKIQTLPSSISCLKNLKAMFLKNCDQLIELCAEVGDLRTLEILDIRHTGIYNLPSVIKHLISLKCLRVSIRKNIGNQNHVNGEGPREMISSNVFDKLHSLEELGIVVDPTDERWDQNVVISIVEQVSTLEELTNLCFYFPTLDCFKTFISNSKSFNGNDKWKGGLRSFSITVGPQQGNSLPEFDVSKWSTQKRLRFSAGDDFPEAILKILKQAHAFELIDHTAPNLSVVDGGDLQFLKDCTIEDCGNMTSIIDGEHTRGDAFKSLNKLHIDGLPKLEHIWKGAIESQHSLIMLKILTLKGCHSLKVLFSGVTVLRLNQLKHIKIEDCKVIEQIIQDGSIVDLGAFPKLEEFELIDLPSLSNISKVVSMKWDSLETLMINKCAELKSFPSTFKEAKKLRSIYCTQDLWNQLVWPADNDATKNRFLNLHQPIQP
ncbi:hypothetical protein Pint_26105 [Pistacia integerrima]|uniref:Uncharacterized protein n=1 Tax=Pistacia integerrima TaxID=434235 RepID=A0ACC0YC33_9ROSI|nr:hypothetical protein Pint_26105 [Pistacia integerrima]